MKDILLVTEVDDFREFDFLILHKMFCIDSVHLAIAIVVGYGYFSVYSSEFHETFDMKILTIYHPNNYLCYSYCLELEMFVSSKNNIMDSVEGLIISVFEFLFKMLKSKKDCDIVDTFQEKNFWYDLQDVYTKINSDPFSSNFQLINTLSSSQHKIESLITDKDKLQLKNYQYYALKIDNKKLLYNRYRQ